MARVAPQVQKLVGADLVRGARRARIGPQVYTRDCPTGKRARSTRRQRARKESTAQARLRADLLRLSGDREADAAGHRARMHSLLVCIARATRLKHMRGRTKRGDHIRQADYRPSMPTGVPTDED